MARLKTYILAGATFLSAITIGHTMQTQERTAQLARVDGFVMLEDIEMTSARRDVPDMPDEAVLSGGLPAMRIMSKAAVPFRCVPPCRKLRQNLPGSAADQS